jgi:hypothetical protein
MSTAAGIRRRSSAKESAMDFEPDFRAPNSNDTVIAAAIAAALVVILTLAISAVSGDTSATPASTVTAQAAHESSCARRVVEAKRDACLKRLQEGDENAGGAH